MTHIDNLFSAVGDADGIDMKVFKKTLVASGPSVYNEPLHSADEHEHVETPTAAADGGAATDAASGSAGPVIAGIPIPPRSPSPKLLVEIRSKKNTEGGVPGVIIQFFMKELELELLTRFICPQDNTQTTLTEDWPQHDIGLDKVVEGADGKLLFKEIPKTFAMNFVRPVSLVPTVGCFQCCEALGFKFYVRGAGYNALTKYMFIPAWIVPTVKESVKEARESAKEVTEEVKEKKTEGRGR